LGLRASRANWGFPGARAEQPYWNALTGLEQEEAAFMSTAPRRQEEARGRYRDELRQRKQSGTQRRASVESAPRGNQRPDGGEVERGVEKLWSVVGR